MSAHKTLMQKYPLKETFQREGNAIIDVKKKDTWQFLSLQDQLYRNQNTLAAPTKIPWACS